MDSLRIAVVSTAPLLSGKPHDLNNFRLCQALAQQGHKVVYLAAAPRTRQSDIYGYYGAHPHAGLKVQVLPVLKRRGHWGLSSRYVGFAAALWAIRRLREATGLDILYVKNEPALARFLLRFRRWLRRPLVVEVHLLGRWTAPPAPLRRDRAVVSRADGVVFPTRALAELAALLHPPARRMAVIPLATEMDPAPDRATRRPGSARVFYVGQLNPSRGVSVLIEAVAGVPGVEVHVVGGRPGEAEGLSAHAAALGVGNRAFWHGFVPPGQLGALLEDADILVLPYLDRGHMRYVGVTKLFEYLALGRPIVASALPPVLEVLRDRENALLVPPGDPKAMAAAIRELVADAALGATLARASRADAPRYSWAARARALAGFFDEVLGQPVGRVAPCAEFAGEEVKVGGPERRGP